MWGHGNAKHEPVYEVRSFQKWLKMLRGKKSWRGVFGRGASKGEARRLLTAASNQFTTSGVRRFDFVRKLIKKGKAMMFETDLKADNVGEGATSRQQAADFFVSKIKKAKKGRTAARRRVRACHWQLQLC